MQVKYVIAYPFGGRPVPCDWHLAVRNLHLPSNVTVREIYRRSFIRDGEYTIPLEVAQTAMVEDALNLGAQYILFIEDDTIPPPGALMELAKVLESAPADVMTCGGVYTTRSRPPEPIVYMGPGEGSFWDWTMGDVFECWATGMGCTMIRMDVFRKMPKPWFKELKTVEDVLQYPDLFDIPDKVRKIGVSTDLFFFTKLRKMGFKALAHGGVLPIHWDTNTNEGYWLPKGSKPTQGVLLDGKEFGWTDPSLTIAETQ